MPDRCCGQVVRRGEGDQLVTPHSSRAARRASLVAASSAIALAACGGGGDGPPQFPPPDVSVAKVVQRSITEWDDFTGRVQAVDAVEIRPRVGGHLTGQHFREGGMVEEGALLFTIDDREYRAAVEAAQADVARADARASLAAQELRRAEELVERRLVAERDLDTARVEMQQAEADALAARARLRQAQLELGFTRITSPIRGRAGEALVNPGNLVAAGESLLTTVVSTDPVHVVFDGDERAYLRYQQLDRAGLRGSSRDTRNPVLVGLADEEGYPHRGEMDFVDNAVNPQTGTIRGRAIVPNPDGVFTPGLFARIRLLGASQVAALLIHEQAVLTDQDRRYVYVIGEGNTAVRKDVTLGARVEGLRVVTAGLEPQDRVVVNGVRKIFYPGQPVSPREVPMDQPDQPAPAAAAGG
jgi:multidrug efflux system membrane fusion protein